jgi:hypothetical protein
MKKLNKLMINSDKLMKNEELMTLRGGNSWVTCKTKSGSICYEGEISICDNAYAVCNGMCGGQYSSSICAGY